MSAGAGVSANMPVQFNMSADLSSDLEKSAEMWRPRTLEDSARSTRSPLMYSGTLFSLKSRMSSLVLVMFSDKLFDANLLTELQDLISLIPLQSAPPPWCHQQI